MAKFTIASVAGAPIIVRRNLAGGLGWVKIRWHEFRRSHDMSTFNLDDRKRKSRNIVLAAFVVLIVIWSVKMTMPQSTLISAWQGVDMPAAPPQGEEPQLTEDKGGQWHSKPLPTAEGTETVRYSNGTDSNKVAVIVETRFSTKVIPLILHFSSVLGPTWPIVIYTSPETMGSFSTSAALARYLKTGVISLRYLPQTVLFTNSDSVNEFMTEKWLWQETAPAEHVLIFQSDSMLCANAARSVDDFFQYDLVGAPIKAGLGNGYNGGLSLRKRRTILRVLDTWVWKEVKTEYDRFEDQWYYNRMAELAEEDKKEGRNPGDEGAIWLPSMEVARTFAVETIDYPHPLGVHQVGRWLKEQMYSLDEWCPEWKLCTSEHVVDTPNE